MGRFHKGLVPLICVIIVLFLYSQASGSTSANSENADQEDTPKMEEPHHIVKRGTSAAPTEVTFTLEKKSPYESITDMSVGSRVTFTLTIAFKAGDTDMKVELYSPDETNTVMILCDVAVISKGRLTITGSETPVLEGKTDNINIDRAVIDLGVVTNNDCDVADHCKMVIEYTAIMVENTAAAEGLYWVSAGAEYDNEDKIWVGQASFNTNHDKTVSEVPEFNMTGPSELSVGSSGIYEVEMYMPNPSEDVLFSAFAPLNTSSVMTICSAAVKTIGNNFGCGYNSSAQTSQLYQATTGLGYSVAEVNLGTLLNKGSRDTEDARDDNLVTVQFIAHMYEDTSYHDNIYDLGAAFEIGSSQIWAAQYSVKALPEVDSSSMPSVTMTLTADDYDVEIGTLKIVELNIEIPYLSTSTYELTVMTPFSSDAAVFQLCSLTMISVGSNLPCVQMDKLATYLSRASDSTVADTGTINLGGVTNLGLVSSTTEANSITFRISMMPLTHTDATVSSTHDLTVSLTYKGGTVETTTRTFTVIGTNAGAANVTAPTFTMTYGIGNDSVEVGLSTRVVLEINTARNETYPQMELEFIMASGNYSSKFKVCRSKVLSAGSNLPCVIPTWLNKKVTYTSKFNDGVNTRAVYNAGSVCNYELSNLEADDKMLVAVDLTVLNHEDLDGTTKEWVSAGAMYSSTIIWIGQLALYPIRTGTVVPSTTPYISMIKNTTLTETPVGYPTVYSVIVKVPPGNSVDLMVDLQSQTAGLHVCGLRIMAAGDNFPCLDQTVSPTFGQWPTGDNNMANLNVSYVTNIGTDALVQNDFFDENTILFEVIVQLARDVIPGNTFTFNADVTYASGQSVTFTRTITATDNTSIIDTNVTQSSNFSFYIANIGSNDTDGTVTKGEAKRFVLDMILPEGVTNEMTVKFLTPVEYHGYMEICGAAVIEVGNNFPCLRKTEIHPTEESRPGSQYIDIMTLSLGYICSSAVTSDEASNRIRVEGVARILPNSSLADGNQFNFYVAVNTNNFEIYVSQITLTNTNAFESKMSNMIETNETSLYANVTDDAIPLSVGVVTTIPVVVNIPPMSTSTMQFDVDLYTNDSVIAVVKDVRLVGTGTNVACLYLSEALNQAFLPVFNSTLGDCQNDKAYVDYGIVSNPGLTHRKNTYKDGDNSVSLEVDVQLTDFVLSDHNSEFFISFGVKTPDGVTICDKKIVVVRDNTEKPELEFTAELNSTTTTDSEIYIDIVLKHANASSGKAVNASMLIYLPPYLDFTSVVRSSVTPLDIVKTPGYINVRFGDMLICEVVEFTILVEANNSVEVPTDIAPDNTIVLLQAGSYATPRPGNIYSANYFHTSEMLYLNFSAKVTQDESCMDNLGMATGVIKDCQLSSSIENYEQRPTIHGRYNGTSEWGPYTRGRAYAKYRYFQVYFGNKTKVGKIDIQRGNKTFFIHYPTLLRLDYSDDGIAWQAAETVDIGSTLGSSDEVEVFPGRPTTARYIRVFLLDDNAGNDKPKIGLKFEFHGCFKSSDISADNICNFVTKQQPTEPEFHYRTMAVNTKTVHVHVCDVSLKMQTEDMKTTCVKSSDGLYWEKLPSSVGSLLGYDKDLDRLYALHQNKRTMLMSMDDGDTWNSVSKDVFFDSRDNGQDNGQFLFAKPIPWQSNDELDAAEPHPNYQLEGWGATSDGIWKQQGGTWSQRVEWTNCC